VNTVRDLIGVKYNATALGALLEDEEWHGFERIGSVLTLSPSNIEKYLGAAETVLKEAYPDPLPKNAKPAPTFGGSKRAVPGEQVNERHRERLRLRKVGMFQPDKKLYPDYGKALEASMVGETKAFFREVLSSGLSLREFLHSDWSMMNPQLAQFYSLPEAKLSGDEFQRVSLPAESHRGGLPTQASILSLTSDGVRHHPVHRGVWVMESIFGKSPPPPPANVEPIATNPTGPKATLRQKLEAHIHDANCAACHAKNDPLGLAFENYDAIGRWRTEEVTDGVGANPKVTAAGSLPDGRSYQTADDFKKLLLGDLDAFNHTFIEKLATYGLRRSMSFSDRDDLKAIAAASKAKDYRVKDIVTALVTSDLFQKR